MFAYLAVFWGKLVYLLSWVCTLFLLVHRFHVVVAPGTKLESGPATLHFCNDILVLVKDVPPAIMGQWKLTDLRRYGAVPNGFVFEGGTRCGFCECSATRGSILRGSRGT